MSDHQDVRPAKQRKTQDERLEDDMDGDDRSDDDGTTEQSEEREDESTTSSGSDQSEEISSSEADSSSSDEAEEGERLPEERARGSGIVTGRPREANLQSRLQEFLPRLQQANAQLNGMEYGNRIDEVSDDAEHYIEMDLSLGVLTEQQKEGEEVKISREGQEDHVGSEESDDAKAEPQISDFLPEKRTTKRKIEELG